MNDKTQTSCSVCFWKEATSKNILRDTDIVQEASYSKVKSFFGFCMYVIAQ